MSGIRTASGLKAIARMRKRDDASVLRTVARVQIRDAANDLREFVGAGQMTAAAVPDYVSGYGYSNASVQVVTDAATATPQGGTAPYAYLWTVISGGFTPVGPTSSAAAFRSSPLSPGNTDNGYAHCTITDANGNVAVTNDVVLYAENTGP